LIYQPILVQLEKLCLSDATETGIQRLKQW